MTNVVVLPLRPSRTAAFADTDLEDIERLMAYVDFLKQDDCTAKEFLQVFTRGA